MAGDWEGLAPRKKLKVPPPQNISLLYGVEA